MAGVVNRVLRTRTTVRSDLQKPSSSLPPSSSPHCHVPSIRAPFQHGCGGSLASQNRADTGNNRGQTLNLKCRTSTCALMPVSEKKWQPYLEQVVTFLRPLRHCWVEALGILIEKGIIGSQSFTLIAVAGSLIGSILCFVEGCFLVLKSSTEYFRFASSRIDQALIVKLLVEAIDMFLIGTALLTFGMALHVMFVGSNELKQRGSHTSKSNFGSFNLKKLKQGMQTQSIGQAKTKVGHAVLLLLQAGVMEKFTDVPMASCADLACFAGAVLFSAAGVFLLSKLMISSAEFGVGRRMTGE